MPPFKKIPKLAPNLTTEAINDCVLNALLSNSAECREEKIGGLAGKGYDRDIAYAFLHALSSDSSIILGESDLSYLTPYFLQLGEATSIAYFEKIISLIDENLDLSDRIENIVCVLGYFLTTVNLITHNNLFEAIHRELPTLIKTKLFKKGGRKGISLYLARIYIYVLKLDEHCNASDLWMSLYVKPLNTSPMMACLHVLMGQKCSTIGDKFVEASDIPFGHPKFSEKDQMYDLINSHLPTFLYGIEESDVPALCDFYIKAAVEKDELILAFKNIFDNQDSINFPRIDAFLISSVLELYQTAVENDKNWKHVAMWISCIQPNLRRVVSKKDSSTAWIKKFASSLPKKKCDAFEPCATLEKLLALFEYLPSDLVSCQSGLAIKMFFLLIISTFATMESMHFFRCMKIAAKYMKMAYFDIERDDAGIIRIRKIWLRAVRNTLKNDYTICSREQIVECINCILIPPDLRRDYSLSYIVHRSDECQEAHMMHAGLYVHVVQNENDFFYESYLDMFKTVLFHPLAKNDLINKDECTYNDQQLELTTFMFTFFTTFSRKWRSKYAKLTFPAEMQNKLCRLALRILTGEISATLRVVQTIIVKRAFLFYNTIARSFELEEYSLDLLSNWDTFETLYKYDPASLEMYAKRMKPLEVAKILGKHKRASSECVVGITTALLNDHVKPEIPQLLGSCHKIVSRGELNEDMLLLFDKVLKVTSGAKGERTLLCLALSIAATINIKKDEVSKLLVLNSLLYNAIRCCSYSLNEDQCAVYLQCLIKHFRMINETIDSNCGTKEEQDRLYYGCAKIAQQIVTHEKYFSRIVTLLISEIIMSAKHLELPLMRLHSICDSHSTALLATTLPSGEKRQYSRVFPTIKKALKRAA